MWTQENIPKFPAKERMKIGDKRPYHKIEDGKRLKLLQMVLVAYKVLDFR